ncbi:hypothetical protein HRbin03_00314 [archaeon HR03]|nr:hypothetical protein HRbin03_00314 [archaeon HR03]
MVTPRTALSGLLTCLSVPAKFTRKPWEPTSTSALITRSLSSSSRKSSPTALPHGSWATSCLTSWFVFSMICSTASLKTGSETFSIKSRSFFSPIRLAAICARRSPRVISGILVLFLRISTTSSIILFSFISFTGGITIPSWRSVSARIEMLEGSMPPTST